MIAGDDAARLAKILGMLGSAQDGEVVAAARQAERIRASLGLMWNDIVGAAPEPAHHRGYERHEPGWRDDVRLCREHAEVLTAWEQEFLASIALRWTLSPKQQAVLDRLVVKCREQAASYA